jgi:cytochrome o ubiquinol oxidase subunit 2
MKSMTKKLRFIIPVVLAISLVVLGVLYVGHNNNGWLNPAGPVASHERHLLVMVTLLMLPIVLPVFFLIFFIAWKYRASNTKADYQPEWDHSRRLETIWWGFPCLIILVLATFTWTSSHSLDPSRPLTSSKPPLTIQVVALQWKWLFIYPQQQIASVNYVQFPAGTPVDFEITADAPMNSFWIPRLGGQIYAMAGMTTNLHLLANQPGNFRGSSANISGSGFASMNFTAHASSDQDFQNWIMQTRRTTNVLSLAAYTALARPNITKTNQQYAISQPGLYNMVVAKYMPISADGSTSGMAGMSGMTR